MNEETETILIIGICSFIFIVLGVVYKNACEPPRLPPHEPINTENV